MATTTCNCSCLERVYCAFCLYSPCRFFMFLAAFLFVTLAIASGLLWISELIEEHSRPAKVIGTRGIYIIIALHLLLYYSEAFPLWHIVFSIFCHLVYLQNFSHSWPVISLLSPSFLASCVLVIADHFLWFFYFADLTHQARQTPRRLWKTVPPSFGEMATFFGICVWLAPLFLFLSLSANDHALPTGKLFPSVPTGAPTTPTKSHFDVSTPAPRTSLFRSLVQPFNYFSRSKSRVQNEGIIAPRSPGPSRPTSPVGTPTFSFIPVSPTRASSFDQHLTPDFPVRSPPRRAASVGEDVLSNNMLKRR
ncbi:DUF396-domain-containing protein [Peniophora sp. CONT]|nr:DUF396-domain-containing protein [Peniophora sp. CONT]